ncbi:Spliceosome-associated protein 49 [Sorochytrium milnesiophthora]
MAANQERNQEATVYIGNLDENVTDALIWELMVQCGPVVNVHLPKDRVTMQHQGYGFCEFASEEDADYAMRIMNLVKLFGKPIRVNKASSDKKQIDIGATIFVGGLGADVDEKALYDTFSAFGTIVSTPKLSRDPQTGESRGFGFISYDSFEASDAAIEAMNGQYLMNSVVNVSYAFKKDGKGERHGSEAERLLAAQGRKNEVLVNRTGMSGIGAPVGSLGMAMAGALGLPVNPMAAAMAPPPPPPPASAAGYGWSMPQPPMASTLPGMRPPPPPPPPM